MKIKTGINIHNRFDFVVRNAETGEIEQQGQAENIVLDRIYTRLCNFQTYFDQIVFGTGSGTPTPSRTTLFNRVGNKAAVTDELVRAFPTSKWVRKITLGTEEFNGNILTEVGISDTTTNINTHAMITDAEGNPLTIEKTSLRIIDIYSTVFITLYDVDTGLGWYASGLRDYLTGGSAPDNNMGISLSGMYGEITVMAGTRTVNISQKKVINSVRFNVQHHNQEVQYLDWVGVGIRCKLPRLGVFEGLQKNNVQIGVGDGVKTIFEIPQYYINNINVFVDGIVNSEWTRNVEGKIVFGNPVSNGAIVTANYFCELIPKDANHVLDVTMELEFGAGQPSPIMPPQELPTKYLDLPGGNEILGGDNFYGYLGYVLAEQLISGDDLCSEIGLSVGTSQFSDAGWFKYIRNGKILYVAKKTIRNNVSWNHIDAVGAVFGTKQVIIGGINYKVRLLSSNEWDGLIQPVHKDGISPRWGNYGDTDIQVNYNVSGNGCYTWTSTPNGSLRVYRGDIGVSYSGFYSPSTASVFVGFRPVLEVLLLNSTLLVLARA